MTNANLPIFPEGFKPIDLNAETKADPIVPKAEKKTQLVLAMPKGDPERIIDLHNNKREQKLKASQIVFEEVFKILFPDLNDANQKDKLEKLIELKKKEYNSYLENSASDFVKIAHGARIAKRVNGETDDSKAQIEVYKLALLALENAKEAVIKSPSRRKSISHKVPILSIDYSFSDWLLDLLHKEGSADSVVFIDDHIKDLKRILEI